MIIRNEQPDDRAAVHAVITDAFRTMPYSHQTEVALLEGLRAAGALSVSLVAVEADAVVGHIALSPARIDDRQGAWYGLGPVAVRPDRQRRGIGQALVRAGLEGIRAMRAAGCVLVGDPAFYGRFDFKAEPRLLLPGVPPQFFQALSFTGEVPTGTVRFHPAFEAAAHG